MYNTKLSIIEVLEEKARHKQEVTKIIRFSYISDMDEREQIKGKGTLKKVLLKQTYGNQQLFSKTLALQQI